MESYKYHAEFKQSKYQNYSIIHSNIFTKSRIYGVELGQSNSFSLLVRNFPCKDFARKNVTSRLVDDGWAPDSLDVDNLHMFQYFVSHCDTKTYIYTTFGMYFMTYLAVYCLLMIWHEMTDRSCSKMNYVCEGAEMAAMNDLDWKTFWSILLSGTVNCTYWLSCDWDGCVLKFLKIHAKSKYKGGKAK